MGWGRPRRRSRAAVAHTLPPRLCRSLAAANVAACVDSIAAAVVAETALISEASSGLRWNRCLRLLQLRWRLDCCGLGLRLAAIDGTLPSFAPLVSAGLRRGIVGRCVALGSQG